MLLLRYEMVVLSEIGEPLLVTAVAGKEAIITVVGLCFASLQVFVVK